MINIYKTIDELGKLKEIKRLEKNTWINMIDPSEKEINQIASKLGIDKDFIKYALDAEEKSRIDIEDNVVMIYVDIPIIETQNYHQVISTMPFGILVVNDDYIITVCLKNINLLDDFKNNKIKSFYTYKKTRFAIQLLYQIANQYLKYLKTINKETDKVEKILHKSTQNKDLLKLLNIEKSLVYLTTSLKSNEVVLERLLRGKALKMYEEDEDILEETIIENKQAIEMAGIYSAILSSMTDAFGSIISNNLNIVMKFLAGITIIISIPTMIASFLGMNVNLGFFSKSPLGFPIIITFAISLTTIIAYILKKKNML
jgi:magnesium transporter